MEKYEKYCGIFYTIDSSKICLSAVVNKNIARYSPYIVNLAVTFDFKFEHNVDKKIIFDL